MVESCGRGRVSDVGRVRTQPVGHVVYISPPFVAGKHAGTHPQDAINRRQRAPHIAAHSPHHLAATHHTTCLNLARVCTGPTWMKYHELAGCCIWLEPDAWRGEGLSLFLFDIRASEGRSTWDCGIGGGIMGWEEVCFGSVS